MNLSHLHPEYVRNRSNWKLVRDLMEGESALKANDLRGITKARTLTAANIIAKGVDDLMALYLPMPNASDTSPENLLRYAQYVQRAYLFNATRRTEAGMVGMVYQKDTVVEMPPKMEYLETDADGSELGLEQQSSEVLTDLMETGREGLLVDFPSVGKATTLAEQAQLGIRASIVIYKAEAILDWDTKKVGAASVLSFVKLAEVVEERAEDYSCTSKKQYRFLLLDEAGNYIQKIVQENGDVEVIEPKNATGKPFKYIPFYFIGSINNRPNCNPAPLLDIATVNIHHYRDSADWQESSFLVGQPTPVFSGLTSQWLKDVFKNGSIHIGSRAAIPLPVGGSAQLLQASPNTMPAEGMKAKEVQMISLGARLITEGTAAETAEAALIKHSADASVLKIIVRNINQAYSDALKAVAEFMGETGEAKFILNDDFIASKMSSDELTSLVEAWMKGAISKPVLDEKLKKGGVIRADVDLEEMNEEIDNTPTPFSGGFSGGFAGN